MEIFVEMRPVLFLGNRRSGTTLLVHTINKHPKMHVPFERYICWILAQLRVGRKYPSEIDTFPGLVREPLLLTLGWCDDILSSVVGVPSVEECRRLFFELAFRCMRVRVDGKTKNPEWIGEKNPEIIQPHVFPLVRQILPDAKFIHMVRHPLACVASKQKFARHPQAPAPWRDTTSRLLERWARREMRVLEAKKLVPVITIRLEDLVSRPRDEMLRLYGFYSVDPDEDAIQWLESYADPSRVTVPEFERSTPGLEMLMKEYSYL